MSVTDPGRTRTEGRDVRGRSTDTFRRTPYRETKPSFMTTEFWAMVAGLVAIIVIYLAAADTSFNLWRAMLLGTAVGVGYFVSRGLAKSGSRDWNYSDRHDDY